MDVKSITSRWMWEVKSGDYTNIHVKYDDERRNILNKNTKSTVPLIIFFLVLTMVPVAFLCYLNNQQDYSILGFDWEYKVYDWCVFSIPLIRIARRIIVPIVRDRFERKGVDKSFEELYKLANEYKDEYGSVCGLYSLIRDGYLDGYQEDRDGDRFCGFTGEYKDFGSRCYNGCKKCEIYKKFVEYAYSRD